MRALVHAVTILSLSTSLVACGGRTANPVMVQQYGDQKKSCAGLESEMVGIQQEISQLLPETDKGGKNTALGVTGFLFIVPLFFMDFSHAEQEEINAYRNRYNNLASIAADKGCDVDTRPIPELKPKPEPEEHDHPAHVGGPNRP